jgi:8-hydroxy-5-deazaflavin:NADPH oxidoreductase
VRSNNWDERRAVLRSIVLCLAGLALPGGAAAQANGAPMKIGIIGSGHIGGTLGLLWAKAGHEVLFSSRHPDELKDLV